MKRFALLLTALLPLAACQKDAPAPTTGTTPPPAASSNGGPSAAAIAAAAATQNGGAPTATAAATAATPATDAATPDAGGLVAGTDYAEIQGGQPYQPLNGKIEVVEVFNFICPA